MPFDSLGRYTASHKTWDHVGNIIPQVERCEGTRPHYEFKPAAWLPVKFYDKHFENWNVILPGKAVALDPDGRVMPAEYGLTSASVVYTANDVAAGVIDVATGEAVTAAKTVVLSQLTGVKGASWTAALAGTTGAGYVSGFMGRFGVAFADSAQKYPIGVAPYACLQWAGGDGSNPAELDQHNYIMQHQVAVLCDYVVQLPLIPAQVTSETVDKTATASNLVFGTQATHNRQYTLSNATNRYDPTTGTVPVSYAYPVIAMALDEVSVAKQTARTLITLASDNTADDVSTVLVTEKSSLAGVTAAGDYFVDYPVGVIFIYSADGATLPTALSGAAGNLTITYYVNSAAAAVVSAFACVVAADLQPGDFLKAGANSNLVLADPATDTCADIIGQVIALDNNHPKDALDRVRTAYNPALGTDASGSMANAVAGGAVNGAGQLDQMPGSATAGYPDQLTYAGAADTLVVINLISR